MSSNYTSLEAELHDAFWESEESPEFDWLDRLLAEHPGRSLEIGSGSGRLLLPLLEKGHVVEGLENSDAMLELCAKEARARGLEPVLHRGNMADFAAAEPYHCVLVPAFTFQLGDDPAGTLANFRKLLVPGGLLYLSVFIPFAELDGELPEGEWYPDHEITRPDGSVASIHTRHRIDRRNRTLHREHHYRLSEADGSVREHRSEQMLRWFTARQMARLMTDAGFVVESAVADFDDRLPVSEDSQIMTLIARRTAP